MIVDGEPVELADTSTELRFVLDHYRVDGPCNFLSGRYIALGPKLFSFGGGGTLAGCSEANLELESTIAAVMANPDPDLDYRSPLSIWISSGPTLLKFER